MKSCPYSSPRAQFRAHDLFYFHQIVVIVISMRRSAFPHFCIVRSLGAKFLLVQWAIEMRTFVYDGVSSVCKENQCHEIQHGELSLCQATSKALEVREDARGQRRRAHGLVHEAYG